jgi:predicted dehydrogenase
LICGAKWPRRGRRNSISRACFASVAEAIAVPDAIFDLGVPPKSQEAALESLPDGAAVLSQKPMGNSLEMAKRIVAICERKKLRAAVNFQFRFCPSMLAIHDLVKRGELGELVEIEVRLNVRRRGKPFRFCFRSRASRFKSTRCIISTRSGCCSANRRACSPAR